MPTVKSLMKCDLVSRYSCEHNFIYAQVKSTLFPVPVFTKLTHI